jgi:hypothetical protein
MREYSYHIRLHLSLAPGMFDLENWDGKFGHAVRDITKGSPNAVG